MEPYRERMADVIKDEFAQQGLYVHNLPERVQEALRNIARRIASDLEDLYQKLRYQPPRIFLYSSESESKLPRVQFGQEH